MNNYLFMDRALLLICDSVIDLFRREPSYQTFLHQNIIMTNHHPKQIQHDHVYQFKVSAYGRSTFLTFLNVTILTIYSTSISNTFHIDQFIEMSDPQVYLQRVWVRAILLFQGSKDLCFLFFSF